MSQPNSTFIAMTIDKSQSMRNLTPDLKRGMNLFFDKQLELDLPCRITIQQFGNTVSIPVPPTTIRNAKKRFTYAALGNTCLYDAIGELATSTFNHIQTLDADKRPERVICIVITDGKENYSYGWTSDSIKELIQQYEETFKWHFLFVGSNQNAYKAGKALGFKDGKALSMAAGSAGLDHALGAIGASVSRFRLNGAPARDEFFTEEDHTTQSKLGARGYSSVVTS